MPSPDRDKLFARFLSRYEEPTKKKDNAEHPSVEELSALGDKLSKVVDPLNLPHLPEDKRKEMAGKRTPQMQDLVMSVAKGLGQCPDVASGLGLSKEELEETVAKDMAVGGLIRGLQGVHQGADTGVLLCAQEADGLNETAEGAFLAILEDPAKSQALSKSFRYLCAEPLRLRKESKERRTPVAKSALDEAALRKQKEERKILVQRMISDVTEGRDLTVTQPVLATTGKEPVLPKKRGGV